MNRSEKISLLIGYNLLGLRILQILHSGTSIDAETLQKTFHDEDSKILVKVSEFISNDLIKLTGTGFEITTNGRNIIDTLYSTIENIL
jgi:coproporphyrinogen III oxidase-like Fe-S oxidoreductase